MMHHKFLQIISAFVFLIFSQTAAYAAEAFTFDHSHSYVLFKIKHFGFSDQVGKWYIYGQVTLDKDKPENSKVVATIKLNDLVTGLPELDKHLKEKNFFNVPQFPTATFVSDKVDVINDKSAKVRGMLTMRGVSKPVVLDVTLNKVGLNPVTEQNTVGFNAKTMLKRSDFGMTSFLPGLSDEVEINISVEANQPKANQTKEKVGTDHVS